MRGEIEGKDVVEGKTDEDVVIVEDISAGVTRGDVEVRIEGKDKPVDEGA